jgi:ribonuclease HI
MKLHSSVYDNLHQLDSWTVTHVRREKNTRADALSKVGLKIARESK